MEGSATGFLHLPSNYTYSNINPLCQVVRTITRASAVSGSYPLHSQRITQIPLRFHDMVVPVHATETDLHK